jgi:CRISPR/Cas system-associated protein Cas7 (RAMP superfamily)
MTSSVKLQAQPSSVTSGKPQISHYKEGDTVRLKKKKDFEGQVFKKSSVGDIADIQVSAVSGKVTYTMNMRDAQTWILVNPQDIISHRTKQTHMEAPFN